MIAHGHVALWNTHVCDAAVRSFSTLKNTLAKPWISNATWQLLRLNAPLRRAAFATKNILLHTFRNLAVDSWAASLEETSCHEWYFEGLESESSGTG